MILEGSVNNFTNRFLVAILSLEKKAVFWPDAEERKEISSRIESMTAFPSCIGFVDGTLIDLEFKPTWKGEDFYTRKSRYSLSAMLVCDDQKLIRYCFTGWAGCTHDNRVYTNSSLAHSPNLFFSGDEYLLADSAYTPIRQLIPAYKKPVNGELVGDNAKFNFLHANLRVGIEHCIGILKARFQSLKGIRRVVRGKRDVAYLSIWIRCCCTLHNILLKRNDTAYDRYTITGEDGTQGHHGENLLETEVGKNKRDRIKAHVLTVYSGNSFE